jgi:arylsulfatase
MNIKNGSQKLKKGLKKYHNVMNKFNFLIIGLFIASSLYARKKPNILIIHADQLRYDCLGLTGNKDIKTPNIDAIASDGVIYQNCFTSYPVSTPSRYSLLSGLYVHEHQGWTNHCTLNPEIETFPDLLKKSGYKTKAVGKCHFTPTYLDVGFNELILSEQDGPGRLDDDYHRDLMKNGLIDRNDLEDQVSDYRKNAGKEYWESFGAIPSNLPDTFYSTIWIANNALKTINNWSGSGNLLMVGFIKPHHPFDPSPLWKDTYDPEKLTLLPGWSENETPFDLKNGKGYFQNDLLTEAKLRKVLAYYYAAISQIDYEVGEMIKLLREKGLYDNTMIIFTSDHGEHMGYHHQLLKGGHMFESIMKIPLIIKFPQNIKNGTTNRELVSNIDLAPTILLQAGIKPSERMSGFDLFQNKIGRKMIFAHSNMGNITMARSKTRKLIYNPDGRSLFFDLVNDPLEYKDLYNMPDYQAEINQFKESIVKWQGKGKVDVNVYLDENAPRINQSNVPSLTDNHREIMSRYFENMMKEIKIYK